MLAQWRVADTDLATRQALVATTGLSPLLCQVLINRGMTDAEADKEAALREATRNHANTGFTRVRGRKR